MLSDEHCRNSWKENIEMRYNQMPNISHHRFLTSSMCVFILLASSCGENDRGTNRSIIDGYKPSDNGKNKHKTATELRFPDSLHFQHAGLSIKSIRFAESITALLEINNLSQSIAIRLKPTPMFISECLINETQVCIPAKWAYVSEKGVPLELRDDQLKLKPNGRILIKVESFGPVPENSNIFTYTDTIFTDDSGVPAAFTAIIERLPTDCVSKMLIMWKLHNINMLDHYQEKVLLPTETGSSFWLQLTRTTPPLIHKDTQELLVCSSVHGVTAQASGVTTFRGPRDNVNTMSDNDIIGACVQDHQDGKIIVLYKSGDIEILTKKHRQKVMAATKGDK
ncbi:hypothetical protein HY772_09015 [Candidatus Woesearchaeota archaeon]|nr:hypothetical protein [Candidatus Woesearchaeota archaeon]